MSLAESLGFIGLQLSLLQNKEVGLNQHPAFPPSFL